MRVYIAGLRGKEIEIKANSLYAAKQEAIKLLKPKKSEIGLLWVVLADTSISTAAL